MRWLAVLVVTTGCDAVFLAERVPPDSAPCAAPVGNDEDGDGLDDSCDPCPFDVANAGDDDEDGIADACDPEPSARNIVLLFTGFEVGSERLFTFNGGGILDGAFRATGDGAAALLWGQPLSAVTVVAGIDVTAQNAGNYDEAGVVFDANPSASSSEVDGTYCVIGSAQTPYLEIFARLRPADDMLVRATDPVFPIDQLRDGRIHAGSERGSGAATRCTFTNGAGGSTGTTGTRTPAPLAGQIALYAQSVDVAFPFLFVVGRAP